MNVPAGNRKYLTRTRIRYFSLATGLYLVFTILNACIQAGDAPRSQVTPVLLADAGVELYIQAPQSLTFDGQRRQGRIELTVKPGGNSRAVVRDESDEEPGDSVAEQEWSFLVSSSEGALLITSDGVSFTPIITLSVSSNITTASFLIEHAALPNTPDHINIFLEDLNHQQSSPNVVPVRLGVATVHLESYQQLFWRRFVETFLSLGSIFALIGAGIDYLRQEQKESEDQNQRLIEAELQQIVNKLKDTRSNDFPTLVQSWAQLVRSLKERPSDLRTQVAAVRGAGQKLARSDVAALVSPHRGWPDDIYVIALRFDAVLDPDDLQVLRDLHFVGAALRGVTSLEDAGDAFSDAYLLGVYLNFAWAGLSEKDRQKGMSNVEKLAGKESADRMGILQETLWGIHACDEQIVPLKNPSLRRELGDWYSSLDIPAEERTGPNIPPPGDQLFAGAVAQIPGGNDPTVNAGLRQWCENLQAERDRRKSLSKSRVKIRRSLWPIQTSIQITDANYDYPTEISSDVPIHWEDAIEELKSEYHHYVQGGKGSGKSWLRICFEKVFEDPLWPDHSTFLPVFYFPPSELLFAIENRSFLYRSFGCSVANCLVAALLESYIFEEGEIHRLAPFFARYGYSVPLDKASLATPTSPVADLDRFYANQPQNYRLGRIRDAMQQALTRPFPQDDDPVQILQNIKIAIEEAGFFRVYLLIDNLSDRHEEKIWSVLQSSQLGEELLRCKIYLKMFGVSPVATKEWTDRLSITNPITHSEIHIYQ